MTHDLLNCRQGDGTKNKKSEVSFFFFFDFPLRTLRV